MIQKKVKRVRKCWGRVVSYNLQDEGKGNFDKLLSCVQFQKFAFIRKKKNRIHIFLNFKINNVTEQRDIGDDRATVLFQSYYFVLFFFGPFKASESNCFNQPKQ